MQRSTGIVISLVVLLAAASSLGAAVALAACDPLGAPLVGARGRLSPLRPASIRTPRECMDR